MTTSWVVLCGLTRPRVDQMDLLCKALSMPAGRVRERQNGGWPGGGVGALGASALRPLGELWALMCVLPGPFTVKLFVGLLWSGGKILFYCRKISWLDSWIYSRMLLKKKKKGKTRGKSSVHSDLAGHRSQGNQWLPELPLPSHVLMRNVSLDDDQGFKSKTRKFVLLGFNQYDAMVEGLGDTMRENMFLDFSLCCCRIQLSKGRKDKGLMIHFVVVQWLSCVQLFATP